MKPALVLKRRTFLQGALAAAATGATPFNILRAGPSPNSKLNIACIGVGGRGAGVAAGMAGSDNIVALCDVHESWHKKAIAGQTKLHGIKLWQDYRVMFDKIGKEIDAVMIATPDHARFAIAMAAIRHGKHVYAEKPLCHTINEVRLLTEEAAKHPKIVTQMGNQGHSTGSAAQINDWVAAGVIGPVREVRAYSQKNYWTDKPIITRQHRPHPPRCHPRVGCQGHGNHQPRGGQQESLHAPDFAARRNGVVLSSGPAGDGCRRSVRCRWKSATQPPAVIAG